MKYNVATGGTGVQFGHKPKHVNINLPFKSRQFVKKTTDYRLIAKLNSWIKLTCIFY